MPLNFHKHIMKSTDISNLVDKLRVLGKLQNFFALICIQGKWLFNEDVKTFSNTGFDHLCV